MTIRQSFFKRPGRLKNGQSGMTLLEVLVAMFVLAVGVLALLSVQLRTVSGVREAEGQTTVSQITQNLIENMLVNPVLEAEAGAVTGQTTGWTKKSFEKYLNKGSKAVPCTPRFSPAMTKDDLAAAQICQFSDGLAAALPESDVYYAICNDTAAQEPVMQSNAVTWNCDDKEGATMIKVLWTADSGGAAASGVQTDDSNVVYTFQARVTDAED